MWVGLKMSANSEEFVRGWNMKFKNVCLVILMVFSVIQITSAAEEKLDEGLTNPGHVDQPSWFKNSFLELKDDVDEAAENGKRVMLYFYQDGCPYCKKLITVNFTQKHISDKTQKHFEVIAINMWGDRDVSDVDGTSLTEKKFAEKRRVMFTPTILFLNEQGEKILRINGYYEPHRFETALNYALEKQEGKIKFKDYAAKFSPPAAKGVIHQEPFFIKAPHDFKAMAKPGKHFAVYFEQKQCPTCDELHEDILKRKESIQLAKQHISGIIDIWDKQSNVITPSGKKTSAEAWAKALDIKYTPSVVFFNHKGEEVFRMEAYLKSFHVQSSFDYVASNAYQKEPSFQRFIEHRADAMREKGLTIDLMN